MSKRLMTTILFGALSGGLVTAQEISFEEYDLDNGLHVILHQDNTVPVVTTSVMYHVGGRDSAFGRTGFAHFFEHLLFEGTKNIPNGDWFKIVASNGGKNNANTTEDRTYYYEVFPSNSLKVGLWMESERMLHPIIGQKGVDTQNEVVKEEKRQSYDNRPYGQLLFNVRKNLYKVHPYRYSTIGEMKDLDAANLDEFIAFNKKYYSPNNAVLVVAGDIDIDKTKGWINDYFADIPRGEDIVRDMPKENPIEEEIQTETYDHNIQIPAVVQAYRTPSRNTKEARVLNLISKYLSNGKSSKLYKKFVDNQKIALEIGAFNIEEEDSSMYVIFALPMNEVTLKQLSDGIDEEIAKLRDFKISQKDFEKLLNITETGFVNSNSSIQSVAGSLATYYTLYGNTSLINSEIDLYRSITRDDIKEVAGKYLNPNSRLMLKYLPKTQKEN